MTCFNDLVDQYFDLLQIGKIYDFSNIQVKISKRMYGNVQNDYEISLDNHATIKLVLEEQKDIPSILYSFVPIANIINYKKDDLIGKDLM